MKRLTYFFSITFVLLFSLPFGATAQYTMGDTARFSAFEQSLSGKIAALPQLIDYEKCLPNTTISVDIKLSASGGVEKVIIDGYKLDEHLIHNLEKAITIWHFGDLDLEGFSEVQFDLSVNQHMALSPKI